MRAWNWTDTSAGVPAWREQVRELREEVLSVVRPLDDTQLNWCPAAGCWSVGECVDHLATTNAAILVPLRRALAEARRAGRTAEGPFRYGFIGRKFLRAMAPPLPHRIKAPAKYVPAPEHRVGVLAVRFARIQDELLATLDEATGLDLARIGVRSPAAWILKLPAGIWLAAMPAHEARHLLQAQAVRADPRFPAPQ